jgi:Protein of unknown function (DUF2867)
MAQVQTDTLPPTSSLWSHHKPGDFLDCYSIASSLSPREAAARGVTLPGWARALLSLRNTLVRPFGLKTGVVDRARTVGIFPVCRESADEMILGLDDRHLDFRVALFRQDGRIYMSTWVHPHNLAGRIYLRIVMPFHILICRGMVARMADQASSPPDRFAAHG